MREREQEIADGRGVRDRADELRHVQSAAVDAERALRLLFLTGQDAEQRRLADAVGADQSRARTRVDLEGDVVEEDPAPGQLVRKAVDVDETHARKTKWACPRRHAE